MEEAFDILSFLPIRFKNPEEEEYIKFLWESFLSNHESEKYQFSFFAYHMLFMSFVYFNIWQVKAIRADDFNKIKLGFKNDFGNASTPFEFSKEGESRVFDFLQYIFTDHSEGASLIGQYKRLVRERNDIAHANGAIPFREVSYFEKRIDDIIRYLNEIQQSINPIITECFEQFLKDSQDVEMRQYSVIHEQIDEALIHEYYLSLKDIQSCIKYDITNLQDEPEFEEIKRIYEALKIKYMEE